MKICCELPLDMMLSHNLDLNQYDFVLYHLYISNETYREYYKNLRKEHPDRLMILDNSAYEFFVKGEVLNIDDFIKVIFELNPNYYILPDVLMDMNATLSGIENFVTKWHQSGGFHNIKCSSKAIAVAQGKTAWELTHCLMHYYRMGIEAVAIPFHNSFFRDDADTFCQVGDIFRAHLGKITDDMKYAIGRIQYMEKIRPILEHFKFVHMLGSHCPLEKNFYGRYDTMDTGYPVKCAIAGYELFKEPSKPNIIIDEFFDKPTPQVTRTLIDANINRFKQL